jgi:hypothetical protein
MTYHREVVFIREQTVKQISHTGSLQVAYLGKGDFAIALINDTQMLRPRVALALLFTETGTNRNSLLTFRRRSDNQVREARTIETEPHDTAPRRRILQ